jgi:dGTPase
MQVFTGSWGDYHRSRLTHTIEVTSVARTVGRALRLNEDLIEALAILHDLGHPPFGHAGEDTLAECLKELGGFNHNAHALRIVEQLERCYPEFPGLNLSHEVLDGQRYRARKKADAPRCSPILEVQVVDAADSITYDTHDADDALEFRLIHLDEMLEQPLWQQARHRVQSRYSALGAHELRRAVYRELIDWQVGDLVANSLAAIAEAGVETAANVCSLEICVRPSSELSAQKSLLESFLFDRVYHHPKVLDMRSRAQAMLKVMFAGYLARPELMSHWYQDRLRQDRPERVVGDYLSGMTDRFARRQFLKSFARVDVD